MSPKNNGIYSKKSIFILGDRMLRHIQDWDITKAINNEQGGGGGGAKPTYMNVKPCFR